MTFLRLVLGLICGIAATGPMSVVMVLLHRRLPEGERYPLPPSEITTRAVEQVADPANLTPATQSALTWLAHFAYGGAAGAIYAGAERRLPGAPSLRGMLFGLFVWTASYLGLLPGLRVLTPATEHPLRRNALMIGAHLVWGWFLAVIFDVLFGDLWREGAAVQTPTQPHRDAERPVGAAPAAWVPGTFRR